jgi:hypothetical protein
MLLQGYRVGDEPGTEQELEYCLEIPVLLKQSQGNCMLTMKPTSYSLTALSIMVPGADRDKWAEPCSRGQ